MPMTQSRDTWNKVTELNHPEGFLLGPVNAATWLRDPRHMGFMLARYKFAAKMMRRCQAILEVGCGEGLGAFMLVRDTPARVLGVDFDEAQILYAQREVAPHGRGRLSFLCGDATTEAQAAGPFDGLVCLDVIEHVDQKEEARFLENCVSVLKPGAVAIFGTPNIASDAFASPPSRAGHINLFDPDRFVSTLEGHFSHVFPFSMNDEMVHTGFAKMAHYLLALCVRQGG
ncbi:hypothetical protein GETHLI_16640 [Geothrix limicola]|uniref:Methyltransferase domain-containing protein n=2 Tax=Geothrix limicola TaxID=2927978 RepID=A0ABQ5QE94_9BACT|nr:hypothetical protein GETHLI_16640 [Geothrix limicola]